MKKSVTLTIAGLFVRCILFGQNFNLEATLGFAKLYDKVPRLTGSQPFDRQIQHASVFTLGFDKLIVPKLSVGGSVSYAYAALDQVVAAVAVKDTPINFVDFPFFGVHGKFFLCSSCRHELYIRGFAGYAISYPVKMSNYEMETSSKKLSNVGIGLKSRPQRRFSYIFELGYWNSGILAKGGVVYMLSE